MKVLAGLAVREGERAARGGVVLAPAVAVPPVLVAKTTVTVPTPPVVRVTVREARPLLSAALKLSAR